MCIRDRGEITAEQLDQLADADRKTSGAASKDQSLMVKVRASNADQSRLLIRDFVNRYNAADRETEHERQRRLRKVRRFRTNDGLYALLAQGDKTTIDALWALLENDANDLYNKDGGRDVPNHKHPRSHAQRMFDAFANRMNGGATSSGSPGRTGSPDRATIVLTATVKPDGTVGDYSQIGTGPVPPGVFDRYLCNATLCLLYTSPSPRDATLSRMPSSA